MRLQNANAEEQLAIRPELRLMHECMQLGLLQNAYVHKAMLHQSCWHTEVAVQS